jgi:hypothetical protein
LQARSPELKLQCHKKKKKSPKHQPAIVEVFSNGVVQLRVALKQFREKNREDETRTN